MSEPVNVRVLDRDFTVGCEPGEQDKLMDLVRRLADENRSLRAGQEQLSNERAQLLNKNELARSRVEAMINRLKSLENNA